MRMYFFLYFCNSFIHQNKCRHITSAYILHTKFGLNHMRRIQSGRKVLAQSFSSYFITLEKCLSRIFVDIYCSFLYFYKYDFFYYYFSKSMSIKDKRAEITGLWKDASNVASISKLLSVQRRNVYYAINRCKHLCTLCD